MAFRERRRVDWGDCDDAGIVYYPHFFKWMDSAFHAMCASAGFAQRDLGAKCGVFGTPLVGADAKFVSPATYGETLDVEAVISAWGATSVSIDYRFTRDGTAIAQGREIRVFVRREDGGTLAKAPVPDEIRKALGG